MHPSQIEDLAKRLREGQPLSDEERVHAASILMAVGQSYFERSGSMFISGEGGDRDSMGLPETLIVCPRYGVDASVFGVYKRMERRGD